MSVERSRVLVAVEELIGLLTAGAPVVLLDVLDEPGAAPVDRPRIPGALSVHLSTDFSGKPSPLAGKRPLPEIAALETSARRWGVNPDTPVVVYDNNGGAQASRAWWTLRWAGFENVRILDGGMGAWTATGRDVAHHHQVEAPVAGSVTLSAGNMPVIEADDAARLAREAVLLDARGRAAYVGEPGKAATGHIPGAHSAPATATVGPDGAFKPHEALRAQFAALGADGSTEIGVYCGSGNAAAHAIAALAAAGLPASLYVGSWSAWSADPSRPVAQGPERG